MEQQQYVTVTALTAYIKRKFDADPHLATVFVRGELSNVTYHSSGHLYFTLKDDTAQMKAVMFAGQARSLQFRLESGMNVFMEASVNVFEKTGQYQLYAKRVEPDGAGALHVQYEQLKAKLHEEGLFDERWKLPLPRYPEVIGIVTAKTGAAIQDIYATLTRRYPSARLILFEALVQGERAGESVAHAIERANAYDVPIDVLIVGRGGGSIEDLWAFNEEVVARAIFSSRIPVISAVGHETDTTIADYVADLRAPTPTAAAELAAPSAVDMIGQLSNVERLMWNAVRSSITQKRKAWQRYADSYVFTNQERLYRPHEERFVYVHERIRRAMQQQWHVSSNRWTNAHQRLTLYQMTSRLTVERERLTNSERRLHERMHDTLNKERERLLRHIRLLQSLNPLSILERGFATATMNDTIIDSVDRVHVGEEVTVTLRDGTLRTTVTAIQKEETR